MYELEVNKIVKRVADQQDIPDEAYDILDDFLTSLQNSGYLIVRPTDLKTSRRGMCGGF